MTFVLDYLRLIIFSAGLLVGLQVPALVDQYAKRVDAHLKEASLSLAGFQHTADRYFDGDVKKLISHYSNSEDVVFRQDADNISAIFQRVKHYESEVEALSGSAVSAAFHVFFLADNALMDETLKQYSYAMLLSPQALLWGLISAFVLAVLIEMLIRGVMMLWRKQVAG